MKKHLALFSIFFACSTSYGMEQTGDYTTYYTADYNKKAERCKLTITRKTLYSISQKPFHKFYEKFYPHHNENSYNKGCTVVETTNGIIFLCGGLIHLLASAFANKINPPQIKTITKLYENQTTEASLDITIEWEDITDEALEKFFPLANNIEVLRFQTLNNLTKKGIISLIEKCNNLKAVHIKFTKEMAWLGYTIRQKLTQLYHERFLRGLEHTRLCNKKKKITKFEGDLLVEIIDQYLLDTKS